MDATVSRFAYRCLPLTIANSLGWELLTPFGVEAEWNGGDEVTDLTVKGGDGTDVSRFASSHFGHGVLTFQTMYIFRTDPQVAIWVRGTPNRPKDGIFPLDGVVETDWLSFTFTMNWKFTRPGRVVFERDEPFCFITPCPYRQPENLRPEIVPLASDPEVAAAYEMHRQKRTDFNARLAANDSQTVNEGWQKWYMKGTHQDGTRGAASHVTKLRMQQPVNVEKSALDVSANDHDNG